MEKKTYITQINVPLAHTMSYTPTKNLTRTPMTTGGMSSIMTKVKMRLVALQMNNVSSM